jgi:hypothetical protein
MDPTTPIYDQILDIIVVLGDVDARLSPYTSSDINALITYKLGATREPAALRELYRLEEMIRELRLSFPQR